ncbi:hypothetical protein [Sphingomonas abietis]|uniref:Uncharacterized protein n=1 Tax=Sphingomonas abietis TaxID=3012344 RepID=A0ABY7NQV4_9SPHN|nr:hypothetical protein [Sphingomonas abietis]WBO23903.1 hypothetical protein PBT88_07285 [Sphingomonas abietis]
MGEIASIIATLRAMASNYAGGHRWDHLDGEVVTAAADALSAASQELADFKASTAYRHSLIGRTEARAELAELQLEAALQRAATAESRLYSYSQHRAARWKQMADFIQSRAPDLWPDYAAISANGSIYTDSAWIEPTYERAMNVLRHRAERAEEEATALRARASDTTGEEG